MLTVCVSFCKIYAGNKKPYGANITRQVYNLFQDLWNKFLGFFKKVFKRYHYPKVSKQCKYAAFVGERFKILKAPIFYFLFDKSEVP